MHIEYATYGVSIVLVTDDAYNLQALSFGS